jgi:hypothetical protein
MPIARKHLSLSESARDFLVSELKAIAGSSRSSLQTRADRIAITYRPRRQGRNAIPEQPIPIDQFRLLAAFYRWRDAQAPAHAGGSPSAPIRPPSTFPTPAASSSGAKGDGMQQNPIH